MKLNPGCTSAEKRDRGALILPAPTAIPPPSLPVLSPLENFFFINKVFIEIRFPCDLLNEHVLQEINVALTISSICHVTNVQS